MSLVDSFPQPPTAEWPLRPVPPTPRARMRGVAVAGNTLFLLFIVVLGIWSALAPLESAAIALGDVEAESSRKTIQHLEGGIVREILVRDGESVAAGQVLVRLDGTKARTELRSFFEQYWDGKAREARLVAERDGLNSRRSSRRGGRSSNSRRT
jgi:HlyD family secretion protein